MSTVGPSGFRRPPAGAALSPNGGAGRGGAGGSGRPASDAGTRVLFHTQAGDQGLAGEPSNDGNKQRDTQNMLNTQSMQNNMYKICKEYAKKYADYVK